MTFEVHSYIVTIEDSSVTLKREGFVYAMGIWNPVGGYVHYLYDGSRGTHDWRVFDLVDKELRARVGF